jgi:hypothetical protein
MPGAIGIALGIPWVQLLGGAAPYDPGVTFAPDLELWFDASRPETLWQDTVGGTPSGTTDPVGAWEDLSGKLDAGLPRHATQGTGTSKPARSGSVLTFDGGDRLVTPTFTAQAQVNVVACVANVTNNGGAVCDGAAPRTIVQRGGGVGVYSIHNGASLSAAASSPDLSTRRSFFAVFNGVSSEAYVNNVLQATGNAGVGGTTNISLGGITGDFMTGELCEFLLIGRAITAPERAALQAYFAAKWSL